MEPLTIIKIILGILLVLVGVTSAYLGIRKNPNYWLNRFFALFFTFASLGFFGFVLYHLILNSAVWVIRIMITTNFLLNLCLACLLMTEFILEYSEKSAMTPKYLLITLGLYLSSILGYFIWFPTVDEDNYAIGEINTHTEPILLIYVSIYRLAIAFYEKQNYHRALIHFKKAYEFNQHDPYLLEYLYYANLFSGRQKAAYDISKDFSSTKKKEFDAANIGKLRIGELGLNTVFSDLETGSELISDIERDQYGSQIFLNGFTKVNLGFNHTASRRFSLFYQYSFLMENRFYFYQDNTTAYYLSKQKLYSGSPKKDPILASSISWYIPGGGQFYSGNFKKGIFFLTTEAALFITILMLPVPSVMVPNP